MWRFAAALLGLPDAGGVEVLRRVKETRSSSSVAVSSL